MKKLIQTFAKVFTPEKRSKAASNLIWRNYTKGTTLNTASEVMKVKQGTILEVVVLDALGGPAHRVCLEAHKIAKDITYGREFRIQADVSPQLHKSKLRMPRPFVKAVTLDELQEAIEEYLLCLSDGLTYSSKQIKQDNKFYH